VGIGELEEERRIGFGEACFNTQLIDSPSSIVSYSHLVVVVVPLQSLVLGVVGMVGRLVVLVARVLGSCRLLFAVGRLVACRASQAVALVPSTCLVVVVLVLLPLPLVLHSLLAPCPSCLVTTRRSRALN